MKRIGIHGVPRSGTTWIGNVFNSNPFITYKHQPLYSYEFKNYLNNESSKEDIIDFFQKISNSTDIYTNQLDLIEKGLVPKFEKNNNNEIVVYKEARYHNIIENLLKTDDEFILIGIIRNPLSTLWSWKNAPNEFKKEWDFDLEWKYAELKNQNLPENFYGYEKWKQVGNLFYYLKEMYSDRVFIVNYSEFLLNPLEEFNKLFKLIDVPMHTQTVDFIKQSKSKSKGTYSVYRDKNHDDDWIESIDSDIVSYVNSDLYNSILQKYLK